MQKHSVILKLYSLVAVYFKQTCASRHALKCLYPRNAFNFLATEFLSLPNRTCSNDYSEASEHLN